MEINLQLEWGEARKCVRTSGSQSKASGWASPPSRATMICASRAREAGASCAVRGASEVKRPNGALISVQIRLVLRTRCMPLPLAPDHLLRYEPQTLAEHRDLPHHHLDRADGPFRSSRRFGLPGHLCPVYRVFPSARLYLAYPLGLNTAVHQRLPSGSVVQKHK